MSKVVAIFGAGSGLGVALGRRFGREGFKVALVARRAEKLRALEAELAAEGIEAASFPADLSDPAAGREAVAAIRARFGRIDVVSYQPLPGGTTFTPAADLDAEQLRKLMDLFVLTPVEIAHEVIPELRERGDGAFFVTGGFTAADPQPFISGLGPAMSAIRNYVFSLHGEVADAGVYAAVVTLTALITGSEAHESMTAEQLSAVAGKGIGTLDNDTLADTYWDLYVRRDRVEYLFPEPTSA
ncbi:SDR family NAD(P)-dependent oxidoreductase [Streptomyces sp. J2-1]|uniref:SDR family NAD(P)-dependent oxidoreductase n=1 Tax=Streptomyces corallincola TaxID=2851888 RepID=UPI001C38F7FD|nr:SDR family NAD(P)-dependent oxidoreductase [Streptomyces corallincola]MBV2354680.1 SDR family NAD(P)-dependent oxidoreductase [Streptomyces corallincola]